jgi:vacuolar protein sorting-associated protein 54
MDKIDSNDFISISNLIEQFVIDFDIIANKKTASLRSWIQNQANKFLQKFHSVKKDKIS